MFDIDKLDFSKQNGLLPCIVQDVESKEVLMLAYMNRESVLRTMETKIATYYSRSRNTLWVKGETSGHTQYVKQLYLDCDCDTILMKVEQVGVACHTGAKTCFYTEMEM